MTETNYKLKEVKERLDEIIIEDVSFVKEDEDNWHFESLFEDFKVSKSDTAVFFRTKEAAAYFGTDGQSEWKNDFRLM
ncbi:hypothetical protein bcgnr5378_06370 [Bacillus cereus]|uniref:Uncharacterized protein n=1 Tax=Bacillus cereus TaxID=1396 RepID=A0A164LAH6_BACCE|nr:hypothetical protein [Bacillus cereus]KZD55602.1 hypothetical protein B4088_5347 [Bacillus cereus]